MLNAFKFKFSYCWLQLQYLVNITPASNLKSKNNWQLNNQLLLIMQTAKMSSKTSPVGSGVEEKSSI